MNRGHIKTLKALMAFMLSLSMLLGLLPMSLIASADDSDEPEQVETQFNDNDNESGEPEEDPVDDPTEDPADDPADDPAGDPEDPDGDPADKEENKKKDEADNKAPTKAPANSFINIMTANAEMFTVTFWLDGAVFTSLIAAPEDNGRATITKPAADPERQGYTFLGWRSNVFSPFDFSNDYVTAEDNNLYPMFERVDTGREGYTASALTRPDTSNFCLNTNARTILCQQCNTRFVTGGANGGNHALIAYFETASQIMTHIDIVCDSCGAVNHYRVPSNNGASLIPFQKGGRVDNAKNLVVEPANFQTILFPVVFRTGPGGAIEHNGPGQVERGASWGPNFEPEVYPNTGYVFVHWLDQFNIPYSENSPHFPKEITHEWTFTAVFARTDETYKIKYTPVGGGTTSPPAETNFKADPAKGSTATADPGYKFIGWFSDEAGTDLISPDEDFVPDPNTRVDTQYWAHFAQNSVVVSYDANGGSGTMGSDSATIGEDYVIKANGFEAPAGYTFKGWNTEAKGTGKGYSAEETIEITGDLKLYAQWEAIEYKVTYDANGGENAPIDDSIYYVGNVVIVKDGVPVRPGYTFIGWLYDGETYEDGDDFTMPAADVTLVAQWTQDRYTVTYFPGLHGRFPAQITNNLLYGDPTPAAPATPGTPGWSFVGWRQPPSATVTGDAGYVAQWLWVGLTIIYAPGDGGDWLAEDETTTGLDYDVPLPAFTAGTIDAPNAKPGWTFSGWDKPFVDPIRDNAEYTALWTQDEYVIAYAPGIGGDWDIKDETTEELKYGAPLPAFTSGTITAPNAKSGWEFKGWDKDFVNPITGNAIYTAEWEAIVYNITYELNGGENHKDNPNSYTIEDTPLTIGDATKDGYTFLGWEEGNTIAEGSTGDKTFTAIWSDAIDYDITYIMNGGTNHADNPATYTIEDDLITLEDPSRDGYEFEGWTPTDNIPAGSTGNKTFTANWSAAIIYDITYVMNGGTNHADNPATYTVEDDLITLEDPTRAGYEFLGWTPSDNIPAGSTGDKTFTAVWSDAIIYDITHVLNGGTNHQGNPAKYTIEDTPITLEEPTRFGYIFMGWEDENEEVTTGIPAGGTGDRTFTAIFEVNYELPISIRVHNISRMYNGQPLMPVASTVSPLPEGYTLRVTGYKGSITNVGQSGSGLGDISGYTITRDSDEADVTEDFTNVTVVKGSLTILPRSIVMTSASDAKTYDGIPLTNDTILTTGNGFVQGEGIDIEVTGVQLDPGTSRNTFTYTFRDGTLEENYNIIYTFGYLAVSRSLARISITVQDNTKMYDGTALVPVDREVTGLPEGHELIVTSYTGSITNVWESRSGLGGISGYTITRDGEDVTGNFLFPARVVRGALTVTPREVVLTSATESKAYDGTALANNSITVSGDGFAQGEGATYIEFPSITDPDEVENEFEYVLNEGTDFRNYEIRKVYGLLIITENADTLVIAALGGEIVYNGVALIENRYVTSALPAGISSVDAVVAGSQTTVGSSANTIVDYTLRNAQGVDITEYYSSVTVRNATLTVTPRPITIAAASATKVFDGVPLTNSLTTITGLLASGQRLAGVTVTGLQTAVGSSQNRPGAVVIHDASGANVTSNYRIGLIPGTLTVLAAPPPPPPPDPTPDPDPDPDPAPATPPAPAPVVEIPDEDVPLDPGPAPEDEAIVIPDEDVPLYRGPGGSWALWNLILSIAGAILALMMGIRVLLKKRRDDKDEEDDAKATAAKARDDDEEEEKKKGRLLLILAIPLLAIVAFIIFILTQDMRLPMEMVDWWTFAHAIIFLGGLLSYLFAYKKEEDDEEDDDKGNLVAEKA